jgi:hypothetical protein
VRDSWGIILPRPKEDNSDTVDIRKSRERSRKASRDGSMKASRNESRAATKTAEGKQT